MHNDSDSDCEVTGATEDDIDGVDSELESDDSRNSSLELEKCNNKAIEIYQSSALPHDSIETKVWRVFFYIFKYVCMLLFFVMNENFNSQYLPRNYNLNNFFFWDIDKIF